MLTCWFDDVVFDTLNSETPTRSRYCATRSKCPGQAHRSRKFQFRWPHNDMPEAIASWHLRQVESIKCHTYSGICYLVLNMRGGYNSYLSSFHVVPKVTTHRPIGVPVTRRCMGAANTRARILTRLVFDGRGKFVYVQRQI